MFKLDAWEMLTSLEDHYSRMTELTNVHCASEKTSIWLKRC